MSEQLTDLEQQALDAVLAEFDRVSDIVMQRFSDWVAANPITPAETTADSGDDK